MCLKVISGYANYALSKPSITLQYLCTSRNLINIYTELKFEASTVLSVFVEVRITSTTISDALCVSRHLLTVEKMSRSQITDPSNQLLPILSAGGKKPANAKDANKISTRFVSISAGRLSQYFPVSTSVMPMSTNRVIGPISTSSLVRKAFSRALLYKPPSIVRP